MLRWYYSVDASTVLEITSRVRIPIPSGDAEPPGVGTHAEEGSGWSGQIYVDDTAGDLIMLVHRRIYCVASLAPAGRQVVGNWFIQDLDVEEMDPWNGTARRWIVTMADQNSLLERRKFVGSDSERGAETDIVRIRWLLDTTELNTLDDDETYIDTAGAVQMSATNYKDRTPADVLRDCNQQSGKNYWVMYREASAVGGAIVSSSVANPTVITTTTAHGLSSGMSVVIAGHSGSTPTINGTRVVTVTGATTFTIPVNVTVGGTGGTTTTVGQFQLWYAKTDSALYVAPVAISNDPAEIDADTAAPGSVTVFPSASGGTRLNRQGGRSPASGVIVSGPDGQHYEQDTDTGDTYVYRDVVAPTIDAKGAAADARALRMLAELTTPDDEVETEIFPDEEQFNDVMAGHRIPFTNTWMPNYTSTTSQPGYSTGTDMRVMRRTVTLRTHRRAGLHLWMTPIPQPAEICGSAGACQGLNTGYDVALPEGCVEEGDTIVAFFTARAGGTDTATITGFTDIAHQVAYDASQFPGPGPATWMRVFYKIATGSETSVHVEPNTTGSDTHLVVLKNVDAPTTVLQGAGTANRGALTIGPTAGGGTLLGIFAFQRNDPNQQLPGFAVNPTGSTVTIDAAGSTVDGECNLTWAPRRWIGSVSGTSALTITGTLVQPGPDENLWGYGWAGIYFAA